MSSNLRIKKVCQFCCDEFIAKTTKTKYCSLRCAQKHYKVRQKEKKIEEAKKQFEEQKSTNRKRSKKKPLQLGKEEVITVQQASTILQVSRKTIYNMIETNRLEAININQRLTRIKKSSLDDLMDFDLKRAEKNNIFDIDDAYTISNVLEKYDLAQSFLYKKLLEYGVPKIKSGKNVLVPKKMIDLMFKNYTK